MIPALPAAGRDGRVGHARIGDARREGGGGCRAGWRVICDDVSSGSGIALAGLGHPRPHGALARLLGRHRVLLAPTDDPRTHAPEPSIVAHRPTTSRRSPFASTGPAA